MCSENVATIALNVAKSPNLQARNMTMTSLENDHGNSFEASFLHDFAYAQTDLWPLAQKSRP